jgi:Flp pilus assembly pilin Flp
VISKLTAASVTNLFVRLAKEEDGTEVVESVLVVGAIAVACLIAMKPVGVNLSFRWSDILSWM